MKAGNRDLKGRLLAQASGNDVLRRSSQVRVTQLTAKYGQVAEAAGLRTRFDRIKLEGYSPKHAKEAELFYAEYTEELAQQHRNDIIEGKIRSAGRFAEAAKIHLSPTHIETEKLSFDETHINQERLHNVTREQAVQWIMNAKISVTVWSGKFERYYGEYGTAYVNIPEKQIRTAFSKNEYDDATTAIMEVLKEYEL